MSLKLRTRFALVVPCSIKQHGIWIQEYLNSRPATSGPAKSYHFTISSLCKTIGVVIATKAAVRSQ